MDRSCKRCGIERDIISHQCKPEDKIVFALSKIESVLLKMFALQLARR